LTIKDVAHAAGASPTTVPHALNDRGDHLQHPCWWHCLGLMSLLDTVR
jgi:hypothetical protein